MAPSALSSSPPPAYKTPPNGIAGTVGKFAAASLDERPRAKFLPKDFK
jgi:hypothetical protein